MPEITCTDVSLKYRDTLALDKVSFTLKENTICGLLGRNGAGKTSLMSLLASFRPATSGNLLYDGKPIFENAEVTPEISFVYHRNDDSDSFKVKDYFKSSALFRPHWDEEYARKLIEEFNIPLRKTLSSLSKGMQATVYGIVGLASKNPVMLYDEAYLGMDTAVRKQFIREIFAEYLRRPHTILFSTHFISEVENMLEDVIVLQQGKVFLHESCDTLRSKGVSIVGEVSAVDAFVSYVGAKPLNTRTLGNQKEVVLFEELSIDQQDSAKSKGLSLSHPSLEDLFVHITDQEEFPSGNATA